MAYVDGFVLPVPKKSLADYKKMAQLGKKVWLEHGALAYHECVADDVPPGKLTSFPKAVKLKDDETVVFAWIVFRSRAHRDRVNAKVMKDPRMDVFKDMPFDARRMIYGGFKTLAELRGRIERGSRFVGRWLVDRPPRPAVCASSARGPQHARRQGPCPSVTIPRTASAGAMTFAVSSHPRPRREREDGEVPDVDPARRATAARAGVRRRLGRRGTRPRRLRGARARRSSAVLALVLGLPDRRRARQGPLARAAEARRRRPGASDV